jgi:hypothetical protein
MHYYSQVVNLLNMHYGNVPALLFYYCSFSADPMANIHYMSFKPCAPELTVHGNNSRIMHATESEQGEQNRPQFKGATVESPITGEPMLWFDPSAKLRRVAVASGVILSLLLGAVGVVSGIFYFRYWATRVSNSAWLEDTGVSIAAFMNFVQVGCAGRPGTVCVAVHCPCFLVCCLVHCVS